MDYSNVEYLADHSLITAVPALVPAAMVAGILAWIAVRDRRREDPEDLDAEEADPA